MKKNKWNTQMYIDYGDYLVRREKISSGKRSYNDINYESDKIVHYNKNKKKDKRY